MAVTEGLPPGLCAPFSVNAPATSDDAFLSGVGVSLSLARARLRSYQFEAVN